MLVGDCGKNTEITFETAAEWTTAVNLSAIALPSVSLIIDLADLVGRPAMNIVGQDELQRDVSDVFFFFFLAN